MPLQITKLISFPEYHLVIVGDVNERSKKMVETVLGPRIAPQIHILIQNVHNHKLICRYANAVQSEISVVNTI
jgi:hypothetical protein